MAHKALVEVGALSFTAVGWFAFWVNDETEDLPEDQKGSLFSRMLQVVGSFQQRKKIQDTYTAERHPSLVASLSSREFTVRNDRSQKEIDVLSTSYYFGYIAKALRKNPGITPPIFRYHNNLPVILPNLPGETHKGFVFAGTSPQVYDTQARDAILSGNYMRCGPGLEVADPSKKNLWNKYKTVDVIIAETTDYRICNQFKTHFLRDLAYLAASDPQPLDSEHPYSDTPVFDCSEKGVESTGDLANIPEQTKKKIQLGRFTVCTSYSQQKTRLSRGGYKRVGAVVAGTSDEKVCDYLFFENLELIADLFKKK